MVNKTMIDDALRYSGISQGKADEDMRCKVEETFAVMERIVKPKYVYGIFEIEKQEDMIKLIHTSCMIKSNDLKDLLHKSESCIILAATLGFLVDQEIRKRQRLNMLDAVVFDACASVMIDKVCDDIEAEIMEKLGQDQYLTMRFSPGYGDVPLDVSRDILQILSAEKRIGLSLTASDMLVPTKSITALIGVSEQKENRQKSCGRCNLVTSCMYRRRGDRCGL